MYYIYIKWIFKPIFLPIEIQVTIFLFRDIFSIERVNLKFILGTANESIIKSNNSLCIKINLKYKKWIFNVSQYLKYFMKRRIHQHTTLVFVLWRTHAFTYTRPSVLFMRLDSESTDSLRVSPHYASKRDRDK